MASDAVTPKKQRDLFLAALGESPNVTEACRVAGIARKTAYAWRNKYAEFAEAWRESLAASIDELEQEAFRRANDGSDVLAIFLLKSHRREIYGDHVEHSGGQKLTIEYVNDWRGGGGEP